jgi:hypothetical protein
VCRGSNVNLYVALLNVVINTEKHPCSGEEHHSYTLDVLEHFVIWFGPTRDVRT